MLTAENMIALWKAEAEEDGDFRISELIVIRQDEQDERTDDYPASAGCCDDGWMEGGLLDTPLGLFAQISSTYGFVSSKVAAAAAREFAKVEGQSWAADLVYRLES